MRYSVLIIGLAALLSVSSCGKKQDAAENRPTIKVEVKQADSAFLGHGVSFSGKIEPVKQSVVSTRIMGQILQFYVSEGQLVNRGDLLVSIRSNDIKARQNQVAASINEIKAAYENAESDYRRFKSLYDSGSASKKELEDMTTRFKMAEARLASVSTMEDELAEMMSYADVRAPYAGVVTQKFLNGGDMASPGMPLLALEGGDRFQVSFMVPESEINALHIGDKVTVTVHTTGQMAQGVVSELNPSRIHSGGHYQVVAQSDEFDRQTIKSGMTVLVVPDKLQKKSVTVDRKALVTRGQLIGLWCVTDQGQALLRWVRVGLVADHQAEILSGLTVGDSYILSASGRLFDGAYVAVD